MQCMCDYMLHDLQTTSIYVAKLSTMMHINRTAEACTEVLALSKNLGGPARPFGYTVR